MASLNEELKEVDLQLAKEQHLVAETRSMLKATKKLSRLANTATSASIILTNTAF